MTAIPPEVNLASTKPAATPAYVRRFSNISSNGQTFSDGSNIRINIDTSTPGAWIDHLSAYLEFDFTVTPNTTYYYSYHANRYVAFNGGIPCQNNSASATVTGTALDYNYPNSMSDYDLMSENASYFRLGRAGAHHFIDEFRIYVQGVPIEEILQYHALAQLMHDIHGVRSMIDQTCQSRYLANGFPRQNTPVREGLKVLKQLQLYDNYTGFPGTRYSYYNIRQAATTQANTGFGNLTVTGSLIPVEASGYSSYTITTTGTNSAPVYAAESADADLPNGGNTTANSQAGDTLLDSQFGVPNSYLECSKVQELRVGKSYRVQLPLMSGVLGTIAEKMFPSLLVASGTMYLDMKMASGTNAIMAAYTTAMGSSVDDTVNFPSATYQFPTNIIGTTTGSGLHNPTTFAVPNSTTITKVDNNTGVTTNTNAGWFDNPMSITYKNVSFVAKQVILQDAVTSAIVQRASQGDISIHTTSYRSYSTDVPSATTLYTPSSTTQSTYTSSLLVPAKIASANALYVIFRDSAVFNKQRYDSQGRSAIGIQPLADGASVQLRIGNELIPQTPIVSSSEALIELLKASHMYPDARSTCELGTLRKTYVTNWGLSNSGSTFVRNYDTNYKNNYNYWNDFNWNCLQYPVVGSIASQYGGSPCVSTYCQQPATLTTAGDISTATGTYVQTRAHTYMGGNLYEPAWYSTFALGFDLDTFAYDSGQIRSGRYLGNNTVTLQLTNCKFYNVDYSITSRNFRVDYYIMHDLRLSFQAGGVVQAFY